MVSSPATGLVNCCMKMHYRIVPSKRPWVLVAQAPKFGGGQLHEELLKWFNYPRARAHPGCKVGSHGAKSTFIVGSSVLRRGQPDSGEGSIVLQSRLTCSLIAKFPQCSVVACSTQISCYRGRTLRTRPRTGVCEPDVMVPKVHQSFVTSADLPSDSLRKNLAWWAVTRRISKNHKTVKIGGWALAQVWALAWDNTALNFTFHGVPESFITCMLCSSITAPHLTPLHRSRHSQ